LYPYLQRTFGGIARGCALSKSHRQRLLATAPPVPLWAAAHPVCAVEAASKQGGGKWGILKLH